MIGKVQRLKDIQNRLESMTDLEKIKYLRYDLPEDISIGANMLLTDMQISEFSKELDDVKLLSAKLANTKLLSTFFPFSTKAKRFKKYYKLHLSSSEQIKVYLKRKKMYIYFTVSLIVLIISFLYYFLFFI